MFVYEFVLGGFRQGRSEDFSKGEGGRGVTVCQSDGTHQIAMSFLPPFVGCLLKKKLTRGGGGLQAPQDPAGYTPGFRCFLSK